jgi:hypothetical protein
VRGRVKRSLNVTPDAGEGREGSGNISITCSCHSYETKMHKWPSSRVNKASNMKAKARDFTLKAKAKAEKCWP